MNTNGNNTGISSLLAGLCYSVLTQAAADAAVRLHGVLVAVALGQTGAVVVPVGTGVGGVRGHTVTQAAALGGRNNNK